MYRRFRIEYIITYVKSYYKNSNKYLDELQYLKVYNNSNSFTFPYNKIKTIDNIVASYDSDLNMPFIIHKNKKLYFPKFWSKQKAAQIYKYFVETENILGGGYTAKAPHQYQSNKFHVEKMDTVLDIGAAEGLFALDVVDKVKKVFIFEPTSIWKEPLQKTFTPFKEKVILINKYVSATDSPNSIKLEDILNKNDFDNIFIKMDIEGSELDVLRSIESILSQNRNIKVACCTYHNENDASEIHNYFNKLNFKVEFSEGVMLMSSKPPFFRKGILRATKLKT